MVDAVDLDLASTLASQARELRLAMDMLSNGAVITRMFLERPEPNRSSLMVNTVDMYYPAQMVDGIISQWQARIDAINQQLSDMGVTNVDELEQRSN